MNAKIKDALDELTPPNPHPKVGEKFICQFGTADGPDDGDGEWYRAQVHVTWFLKLTE